MLVGLASEEWARHPGLSVRVAVTGGASDAYLDGVGVGQQTMPVCTYHEKVDVRQDGHGSQRSRLPPCEGNL